MDGNTPAALEFLRRFHPSGPWVLTSISTDRKGVETRTFTPATAADAQAWIEKWNGKRNCYFSVNPVLHELRKKAEKADIKAMTHLHVDIDPRAGEDLASEQQRILALLTEKLPEGVLPPSCVVFSGGGYAAYWALSSPMPIGGEEAAWSGAERYNIQLERLLGGDNCFNIDRIMRLPGTVNIPDEKKRRKGRVEALSSVVFFNDLEYDLKQFVQAPLVQREESGSSAPTKVRVSGNVARLPSLDALDEWNVDERVKVLLAQGHDPERPKGADGSRSAWLFDACCQLVRRRVPDEVIYAVITDPDYGISASVLDKGSNASKYAIRQIERAKEEADDPWLRKLNERHAVIRNWGGRCRVIEEVHDYAMGRSRLTKQSFEDFRNSYMNVSVRVGEKNGEPVLKPVGRWWLEHPARRQYDTLVFAPGKEVADAYNLWTVFGVEPRPGDWSLFEQHLFTNLCAGNREYCDWLLNWMARCVQQPDTPGETAVVLRGKQGTGKGFFAKTFGSLWGRHYMHVTDPKHLVGSFNAHLRDCVVLFGDEAFFAGDKKHESILKTLVTEDVIIIEAKGVDAEAAPNYVHLILASNNQWVVPADADDRRFFVLDVGDDHASDVVFFQAVQAQLDAGGREGLLYSLLSRDISAFDVRNAPKTKALQDQKIWSLAPDEEWWFRKLERGTLLDSHEEWTGEVLSDELVQDYIRYARNFNVARRGNETFLGKLLRRVCPAGYPRRVQKLATLKVDTGDGYSVDTQRRAYHHTFPPLESCRAHWSGLYGTVDWPPAPQADPTPVGIPF